MTSPFNAPFMYSTREGTLEVTVDYRSTWSGDQAISIDMIYTQAGADNKFAAKLKSQSSGRIFEYSGLAGIKILSKAPDILKIKADSVEVTYNILQDGITYPLLIRIPRVNKNIEAIFMVLKALAVFSSLSYIFAAFTIPGHDDDGTLLSICRYIIDHSWGAVLVAITFFG